MEWLVTLRGGWYVFHNSLSSLEIAECQLSPYITWSPSEYRSVIHFFPSYFLIVKNWRTPSISTCASDEVVRSSCLQAFYPSFFLSQESRKDGSISSPSTFSSGKFAIQISLSPSPSWSVVHSISDHKLLVGEETCWCSQTESSACEDVANENAKTEVVNIFNLPSPKHI